MALAQYGTLITTIGLAQIANAQITQAKVGLEYIALGDGNGAHYVPTQNQTALVHEVWRGPIAELSIDPTNNNRIIIDAVIPVTAGGFTIREIGIFDDKNQLIAIGQYPEKYKPQLSEGVSEETLIHFVIETNNADVVKLNIDPTVIIATRKYVDAKVADAVGNIGTDLTELKTEVTTHLDDDERHLQVGERNNWNNKADKNLVGHYIDIVLNAGWAKSGLHIPPSMYKDQFGYVTIAGMFRREDGSSNNVIANLPIEYRPKIEIISVGMKVNQPFAVYAEPDGRLMVTTSESGFFEFSMTYPTAAVR